MPLYTVERYDTADDPGRDGRWRTFARVRRENLPRTLARLFGRGYDGPSVNVIDPDGNCVSEDEWPEAAKE